MLKRQVEHICCVVCHESFKKPHALPCGHSYCGKPRKCLEAIARDNGIICAQCNKPFNLKIDDLNPLFGIQDFFDALPESPSESEVKQNIVEDQPDLQNEDNIPDTPLKDCLAHKKPLDLFCTTCGFQICSVCFRSRHFKKDAHKVEPVDVSKPKETDDVLYNEYFSSSLKTHQYVTECIAKKAKEKAELCKSYDTQLNSAAATMLDRKDYIQKLKDKEDVIDALQSIIKLPKYISDKDKTVRLIVIAENILPWVHGKSFNGIKFLIKGTKYFISLTTGDDEDPDWLIIWVEREGDYRELNCNGVGKILNFKNVQNHEDCEFDVDVELKAKNISGYVILKKEDLIAESNGWVIDNTLVGYCDFKFMTMNNKFVTIDE